MLIPFRGYGSERLPKSDPKPGDRLRKEGEEHSKFTSPKVKRSKPKRKTKKR